MSDCAKRLLRGYAHEQYAFSLREFGEPLCLPRSGGRLLVRPIPGGEGALDAMGVYPLVLCENWQALLDDLHDLDEAIVSVVFVADPFAELPIADWQAHFSVLRPYKDHHVADFTEPYDDFVRRSHKKRARGALRKLDMQIVEGDATANLDAWCALYGCLVERHGITGLQAFSREAFAEQLAVPGTVYVQANLDGEAVGGTILYVHDDRSYSHLSASSDAGYACNAAYAIRWTFMEYLSSRVCWHEHGAGAGIQGQASDGLNEFKRGWSNTTRTAYLCGYIHNPAAYEALVRRNSSQTGTPALPAFFPAYRGQGG